MNISSNNQSLEKTSDLHVVETRPLIPPRQLHQDLPLDYTSANTVSKTRRSIQNILHKSDSRLLVIVGPCSIHDVDAAMEYATRLMKLKNEVSENILIVMRVYFEKPRTVIGWKGLINDPDLDNSFNINKGIKIKQK